VEAPVNVKWKKAAEVELAPHLFLWGESGTGKTAAATRAVVDRNADLRAVARGTGPALVGDPGVFVVTGEPNALNTIRYANPQAAVVVAETKEQTIEVFRAAREGALVTEGFHTLVIDGLTEVQRQIAKELNPKSDAYWKELATKTLEMLLFVRAIPMPVICTGLEGTMLNERTKTIHVGPLFDLKKAPGQAMSTMAAVGRTTKTGTGDAMRYCIDFSLDPRFTVKEAGPVTGRTLSCGLALIEALAGRLPHDEIRFAGPSAEPETPTPIDSESSEDGPRRPKR
jgi:hypothetical protein